MNILNLFEEEDFYKPVRESNFLSNNYTEYESNGDRNKTLSIEEYLNKIRKCFKNINHLKKSDTWKIQSTIVINFISSKDNDEEHVIHSMSGNTEFTIYDNADKNYFFNYFFLHIKLDWKHQ